MRSKLFLLILSLFLFAPSKADTQREHKELQKDIKVLDSRLDKDEEKAKTLRNEVRALEKKLGQQTRKVYETEKKIEKVSKHLKETHQEQEKLKQQLEAQKKGLSQQLQALYSAGEQSHMRLLLKQDDPSDIGRTVKYFEYLNRSRVNKIQRINTTLTELKKLEKEITTDKQELEKLGGELSRERAASKSTLDKRQQAYKKIKKDVNYKRRQLRDLRRKEARLQTKIDNLVASSKKSRSTSKPSVSKENAKTVKQSEKPKQAKQPKREVGGNQNFVANQKFSSLRGKLSWPVKGRIIHNYGERRNERQRWKGAVIAASGGSKVKAIARGKVEFSGWFNGYGYLIIIRHDNNYRSLYGYNRAIYVREGQVVNAGSTIAAVGNSGGQQQNALYFEIRQGKQPRNPSSWCR